jgi:hypothetical protein
MSRLKSRTRIAGSGTALEFPASRSDWIICKHRIRLHDQEFNGNNYITILKA